MRGIDAIEVSGGTSASGDHSPVRAKIEKPEQEAYNLDLARQIKGAVNCPVMVVGGFRSYEVAENSIVKGGIDYISMARPYTMVIRQNRCIGCERCMEACTKTNHVPSYGYRTIIMEQEREISPGEKERLFLPLLCNHCNRPPCVRVCPTGATFKDKDTGIVMMDQKRCIGCKTCMAACPYNARYFREESRAVDKCNFCFDTRISKSEKLTACAAACPAGVRIFGELTDSESEAYKLIHMPEKRVWVLRPETGALPNVFYMND